METSAASQRHSLEIPSGLGPTSWWKNDLVVQGADGTWHTRRFVVTQMANTEAVHFDLFADVDYEALRTEPHGWSGAVDGQDLEVSGDIVTASVRQIAWELESTLGVHGETLPRSTSTARSGRQECAPVCLDLPLVRPPLHRAPLSAARSGARPSQVRTCTDVSTPRTASKLHADLRAASDRDPEQEVTGVAVPLVDAVMSRARTLVEPADSGLAEQIDLISVNRSSRRGHPCRRRIDPGGQLIAALATMKTRPMLRRREPSRRTRSCWLASCPSFRPMDLR